MDSPLDAFLSTPGAGGDAARDSLANPPLPGEMPDDTATRVITTQRVQQQAQDQVNRVKGRDLAARSIPSYNDPSGNVQAVTGADGTPITNYNKSANVGYDGTGNPVALNYNSEQGPPVVRDAMEGVPVTTDPKTGNQYQIRAGLPWQYKGQDPDVAAAALEQQKQKAVSDASTALGRQLTLDERQLHRDTVDFNANKKALISSVPSLNGQDNADPAALHAMVDAHFNDLYAAPEANETAGWFGSGGLSPQATVLRQQLDAQKAAAHQQVDGLADLKTSINARAQHIDQQTALQQQMLQSTADSKLSKAAALGAIPPQDQSADLAHAQVPDGATPSPAAATQPTSENVANAQQAIQDARDGKKDYGFDDAKGVQFQPDKIADGLNQAVKDGIVDPQWASQHQQEFQDAQDKYRALQQAAGGAQELKTLLHGGLTGSAFWAGSIPGAKGGAAIAAAIPGVGESGIGELIGGAIGGLATGTIAHFAAAKALDKLADYSDTIKSLNASAELHPVLNAAGELAGMSLNAPSAISNVYRAASIAREAGTTADAVKLVGKIAAGGAVGGVAFEGAVRPLFDYAKNAVLDQLGVQHDAVQSPTVQSLVTNAALGIITAGHNIEFKDYSAGDVASILTRAKIRQTAGIPLDAEVSPEQMGQAASSMGLDSIDAAKVSAPLTKEEMHVFNSLGKAAAEMKASGKFEDSTVTGATAKQASIPNITGKDSTPITTATIETKAGEPPPEQPRVGAPPPEKPVSGKVVEPTEPPPSAEAVAPAPAQERAAEPPVAGAEGAAPVSTVDEAAHEAATSPKNDLPVPTDAQKDAGNYPKGHVNVSGLDISIENPAGSSRRPEWPPLTAHYGYIRGTEGNDGDHLDTFIKPGTPTDYQGPVFVINQQAADGTFDEHKAVIGVNTPEEARQLYASNYSKVPGIHSIATFPDVASFKWWANATKAPRDDGSMGPAMDRATKAPRESGNQQPATEGGGGSPAPEAIAKQHGIVYQGESNGLHAFKDPETGGNFSVKTAALDADTVGKKLSDLRESFKAPPVSAEHVIAVDHATKTANAALKLHSDALKAMGEPVQFDKGPVHAASGIETDTATHRIRIDPEKIAKATASMDKAKAAEWIKRAVAQEVIHVGTLKYAEESPANMAKLMALNDDKELMQRAGEAYGSAWPGLAPFAKAAEAARMLIEGPEQLTEATHSFLEDFLKWLRAKLGNLSKDVKDLIRGIEEKMGKFRAEEKPKAEEPAPPKKGENGWNEHLQKQYSKFKTALTKAENAHDWPAVLAEKEKFDKFFGDVGAYPDDWARWERAAEDAQRHIDRGDKPPQKAPTRQPQKAPPATKPPAAPEPTKLTPKEQAAKDAAGDLFGAADPSQERENEPFFSQLTRTIQELPQATMTVGQARAAITKGAKADEIKQQGIFTDALSPLYRKSEGDKVSKSDLLGYSLERQAKVEDVTLGGNKAMDADQITQSTIDDLVERLDDAGYSVHWKEDEDGRKDFDHVIKRSNWTSHTAMDSWGDDQAESLVSQLNSAVGQLNGDLFLFGSPAPIGEEQPTHFGQYQLPGADEGSYREQFVTWPENRIFAIKTDTLSDGVTHRWQVSQGEKAYDNVEANTREQAIERVRERGTLPESKWSDGHSQYSDIANPIVRIRRNLRTDATGKKTYFIEEMQGPAKGEQEKMPPEVQKRIYEIGMKRALRDAADEGADRIGWTTGEQQAERYSLEKQVKALRWDNIDGNGKLIQISIMRPTDSKYGSAGMVSDDKLAETVGKEMAEKILSEARTGREHGEFKGLDLKIGGEGLKRLYDQTLPRIANELAKKFGVKVGSSRIDTLPGGAKEMGDVLDRKENPNFKTEEIHSLDIPKSLADHVANGQRLFAAAPEAGYDGKIPPEKRKAMTTAFLDLAEEANTPDKFATSLLKLGPKAPQFSQALWFIAKGGGAEGPDRPDWASIYEKLAPKEQPAAASSSVQLAAKVTAALRTGSLDRRGLAELAKDHPDLSTKEVDEAAELGIVMRARELARPSMGTPAEIFKSLLQLYDWQPNLTSKTSTSKVNQAYSTPVPLSYLLGEATDIRGGTSIYDPTGGNGSLVIGADPSKVTINEIDPTRIENLKAQGFKEVTAKDATEAAPPAGVDRIETNPPFGTLLEGGEKRQWLLHKTDEGGEVMTPNIDQAIVIKALNGMTEDGKAGIIIGGKKGTDAERAAGYKVFKTQLPFFLHLYKNFNVVDHFTVAGELYEKQGAGWPVDVIIVDGKGASKLPLPFDQVPPMLDTWEAVRDRLLNRNEDNALHPTGSTGNQPPVSPPKGGSGGSISGLGGKGQRPQPPAPQPEPGGKPPAIIPGDQGNTGGITGAGESGAKGGVGEGPGGSGVQSGEQSPLAKLETGHVYDSDNAIQTEYTPRSKAPLLNQILVPTNLRDELNKAFDDLEARRGNIDEFALKEAKWLKGGMDELHGILDGGQIDAFALGIDKIMQGTALITGDQTGMGKGRVAAGVQTWAQGNGHIPIFITAGDALYLPMMEDFADIHAPHMVPFITNTGLKLLNSDEEVVHRTAGGEKQKALIQGIIDSGKLPGNANVVFTTYDQIKGDFESGYRETPKEKARRQKARIARPDGLRTKMMRALASRSVFVMDESHSAAGNSDTNFRLMQILMGWDNQNHVDRAEKPVGAYYSSATFAKRPDNMPIYAVTDLGKAVPDPTKLPGIFEGGGVAMQQAASAMLARSGQYIRREMNYAGVTFRNEFIGEGASPTNPNPEQYKLADAFTAPLRDIVDFSGVVQHIITEINGELIKDGQMIGGEIVADQLQGADFADQIHNMVNQYMLAVKAKDVGRQAVQLLAAGSKPVITVENTMEGPYEDTLAKGFEPNFRGLLHRYLAKSLEVTRTKTDGMKVDDVIDLDQLMQHPNGAIRVLATRLKDQFDTITDAIKAADLGGMHISPIDTIKEEIEKAGHTVGEITGRKTGVRTDGTRYKRPAADMKAAGKNRILAKFNDSGKGGEHGYDGLILNRAGSTGISAHAAPKFFDKRQRKMLVAQPNSDISIMMQMYGRIFRKGQLSLPEYIHLLSQIAGERRIASVLARKLRGLKANTTSNAKGAEMTDSADLFNNYGDMATYEMLERHPEIVEQLQHSLQGVLPQRYGTEGEDLIRTGGNFYKKTSGETNIMPAKWQDIFYNEAEAEWKDIVANETEMGTNELLVENQNLRARIIDSEDIVAGVGDSEFEKPAVLETLETKAGREPVPFKEVAELADQNKPTVKANLLEWRKNFEKARADRLAELDKINEGRPNWSVTRDSVVNRMIRDAATITNAGNAIGSGVMIDMDGASALGIVTDVKFDDRFPMVPSRQKVVIHINTSKRMISMPAGKFSRAAVSLPREDVADRYDSSVNRSQRRYVVTGNVIAGWNALSTQGVNGQKIVTFTMEDGSTRTGILLPLNYNPGAAMVPVKDAPALQNALSRGIVVRTISGLEIRNVGAHENYEVRVPAARNRGGKYWREAAFTDLMRDGQMTQRAAEMVGTLPMRNLAKFFDFVTKNQNEKLSYTQPRQSNRGGLAAANPDAIRVGDRVTVYKKTGSIASIKGKKLTVNLDEGGVIGAHVDNVTPIPAETPEAKAAAAAQPLKGVPQTAAEKAKGYAEPMKKEIQASLQSLLDRAKAIGGTAKDFFTGLKKIDDYWKAKGEWLGTGDIGDPRSTGRQKSDFEVRQLERAINDKFSPEAQEAVTNFIQAAGNRQELLRRADASRPLYAKGYQRAANLSPEEMGLVKLAQEFFGDKARQAQEAGLLHELLEDYVNQLWDRRNQNTHAAKAARNQNIGAVGPGRLNTTFENAFQRTHESYFAGEQKGLTPHTKEIGKLMAVYAESFNRVMGNRAFIKKLATDIVMSDGRPAAVISGYAKEITGDKSEDALLINPRGKPDDAQDYKNIEHPAAKGWKWLHTDEEGNKTYLQGDLIFHPDIADDLRRTLGKSAIGNVPLLKELRNLQFAVKQTLLSLSAFHFVQEGTHAIGHTINPFNPVQIDMNDPVQRELINSGLMLASYEARRDFMEGVAGGGLIDRIPVIGKMNKQLNAILFEDYIPRLKMTMALHALDRNLARFAEDIKAGKITREQVVWKTAQQANDAFGEQNYRLMGRSQTFQDILRLSLLAPDFLESRFRFAADATTKWGGEQRRALIILAAAMFVTAKLVEKALTGSNDWKHPFAVTYKGRQYALRSVPGDMVDFFQDTRRFIYGRLSPIISRGIIEGITGRDWRGQKRSFADQMEDLLKAPVPIAVRGLVDKREDITPGEQIAGALGAHIKRQSDITDIRNVARDWQTSRGKPADDAVYPPSKYLPLKYALEDGNEAKAKAAFRDIAKAQGSAETVKGLTKSLNLPFSGKLSDEPDFLKSLSPSQRATYNRADMKRTQMIAMLNRIAASTPVAAGPVKAPVVSRSANNPALMFRGFH